MTYGISVDWGDGWMDTLNWGHDDEADEGDYHYSRSVEYSDKTWDCYMDYGDYDALNYIHLALKLDPQHANDWNRKAIISRVWDDMGIAEML